MIRSYGIKVKSTYAEILRKELIGKEFLRTDLKIKNEDSYVILPLIEEKNITSHISFDKSFEYGYFEFEEISLKISDYKKILSLPEEITDRLPTSFDVIGSIILIKLDDDLLKYQSRIGEALLKTHVHINSVYRIDPVDGEFRTRSVKLIGGRPQTKTIHKEYGLNIEVDIEKTYFNPRLANERRYIAGIVKTGEIILDMFTGVAPFPLMISKFADPEMIIAIDKNQYAIDLAEKNVKNNNIKTDIRLFCNDAGNSPSIVKKLDCQPDRIIMNLPFHSHKFFLKALQCVKQTAAIHLYMIGSEESINVQMDNLIKSAISHGYTFQIDKSRKIKSYSPHEFYMGIDITAKKSKEMPT